MVTYHNYLTQLMVCRKMTTQHYRTESKNIVSSSERWSKFVQ